MTSDELLEKLNSGDLCTKCGRILDKTKERILNIKTVVREYFFCVPCVREAFHILQQKKNKSIEEVNLLMGMREFLQHIGKVHES